MNEIKINNTNGLLTVSSLQVARDFRKSHKHVLEKIVNLMAEIRSAENSADVENSNLVEISMFIECTYSDSYGRLQKYYEITRDGFSLLVMSFTGKKALEWKLKYIEAFNSMERQLTNINNNIEEIVNKILDKRIAEIVNIAVDSALTKKSEEIASKSVQDVVETLVPCFYLLDMKTDVLEKKIDALEKNSDIEKDVDKIVKSSVSILRNPKNKIKCRPRNYQNGKIAKLPLNVRQQVDEMIISGEYSCQKIADFIIENTDMQMSYMTVSRYIKKYFSK